MFKYTGHMFVDVGIAVMENMCHKACEEFTDQDMVDVGEELQLLYAQKVLSGYLTIHFPNSGWCNPTIGEEKKREFFNEVLGSYGESGIKPRRRCAFCENDANLLANRKHIPLLTGEKTINNAPTGSKPGLPVCGYCIMAIQFYPLGTLKVEGKPLFWWSTDQKWTRMLVKDTYLKVRQVLALNLDKLPSFSWPRTRLLQVAQEVLEKVTDDEAQVDLIAYHLTNYGASPDYATFVLPQALLGYLQAITVAPENVRIAHSHIVGKNWEVLKKGKPDPIAEVLFKQANRNFYYEALVRLVQGSHREGFGLIRRFFLQRKKEFMNFNNYELTALFLRKVMDLEVKRLQLIKELADNIMQTLVLGNSEKRWLAELYNKQLRPGEFLRYLIRVQKRLSERGAAFAYEDVLCILNLESEEELVGRDSWLVQDLMLIRMLEVAAKQATELVADLEDKDNQEAKEEDE